MGLVIQKQAGVWSVFSSELDECTSTAKLFSIRLNLESVGGEGATEG